MEETLIEKRNKRILVKVDKKYFRPLEVDTLIGDSSRIRSDLGWKPKITFEQLVEEMVRFDLALAKS